MKKRLNEQLSVRSALLILGSAVLLILMSATVAKASCGLFSSMGCDINCTKQIINTCKYVGFDCYVRTCQRRILRGIPPVCNIYDSICGACIADNLNGCADLPECCNANGNNC